MIARRVPAHVRTATRISGYDYQGMIYQKSNTSDMNKLLDEWKSDSSDRDELVDKHYKYVGVGRSNKYWVLLFTD